MSNRYKSFLRLPALAILLTALAAPSRAVGADLSKEFAHPGFNRAQTSIAIVDAMSGTTIADYAPDLKLNPASCAKVFTSAAALSLLGPDHRFRTAFFADRPPQAGAIGTLFVAGDGDPVLINEELARIAVELSRRGVRRIADGIVIDNSPFDSYDYPHKETGAGRAYTSKTAATAVNFNSIAVVIGPGKKVGAPGSVSFDPPVEIWPIVNRTATGGKFRTTIAFGTDKGREALIVTGRVPPRFEPQKFYRSSPDPVRSAGMVIGYWLAEAGIDVQGPIREGQVPPGAVPLLTWESKPLRDVMADMNKVSNNFIAEQTLKHLGAAKFGAPGSTAKGIAAVEEFLASIGIPKGDYRLENGSGLSEISRVSARQLAQVLASAYKNPKTRDALMASLSVLGVDGTTKTWRFAGDLSGRILVKTGTLDGISALAGYAPAAGGRMAAFAILANGLPRGAWTAHEAQMGIVRAIAEGAL